MRNIGKVKAKIQHSRADSQEAFILTAEPGRGSGQTARVRLPEQARASEGALQSLLRKLVRPAGQERGKSMEFEDREARAKRGRGSTGDALTSSLAGFRQGLTHFRTSVGKIETGQRAAAKYDYINREGKYEKGREEADHMESGNMPEWAKDQPREYWEAADKHERENGRLFVNSEFALPRELDKQQQIALAREQVQSMARTKDGQPLPYSFAIHDSNGTNPHFHIIISERGLDGQERTPETWFKKAPKGAKKTTDLQRREWVMETRVEWCECANRHLALIGSQTRLDPRSYKEQGIDQMPTVHVGYTDPKRPYIRKVRQERNEFIQLANKIPEASKAVEKAEKQVQELAAVLLEIEARAEAEKAAGLVQAQEQRPATPRQVHDQVQHDQAKHQAPARSSEQAEIHAPERARIPAEGVKAWRQEDAGGLGATPPVQRGEPSGAAVQQGAALPHHGQDLKAQEQQQRQSEEAKLAQDYRRFDERLEKAGVLERAKYAVGIGPLAKEEKELAARKAALAEEKRKRALPQEVANGRDSTRARGEGPERGRAGQEHGTRSGADGAANDGRLPRDRTAPEASRKGHGGLGEGDRQGRDNRGEGLPAAGRDEGRSPEPRVEELSTRDRLGLDAGDRGSLLRLRGVVERVQSASRELQDSGRGHGSVVEGIDQDAARRNDGQGREVQKPQPAQAVAKKAPEQEQGKELSNQQKGHVEGLKPEALKREMLTPQQQRVLDRELAKKREREGRGRGR